jgi:hypothetical protein
MMLRTLEAISVYLNLVVELLKRDEDYSFITSGTATLTHTIVATQNQETQCMSFGSTIWIANNEDEDTLLQKKFLTDVGVKTAEDLRRHVAKYATRALGHAPSRENVAESHQRSPGQKFLYNLVEIPPTTRGTAMVALPRDGVVAEYALGTRTKTEAPPVAQIVVITGKYEGEGGVKMHAEQKLLAALGRALRLYPGLFGIKCAGLKRPCGTCGPVLEEVKNLLAARTPALDFDYSSSVGDKRDRTGLGEDTPPGIRALEIGAYFT